MVRVAINGFGRIGRVAFRVARTHYAKKVKIVAINTSGSMPVQGWAQMLKYDSVYGKYQENFKVEEKKKGEEIGALVFGQERIPVLAQREPAKLPWGKYQVAVVIEATGVFTKGIDAKKHIHAGAQKVVISAPSEDTPALVIGVNEEKYRGTMVNNTSCTTNCVAPVAKIIGENLGIEKAMMSTIHAYTAGQELVDGSGESLRRARAAAVNLVPTSTGAARATIRVMPELAGLFDGLAYRVPLVCGSLADFVFLVTKRTSVEEVNRIFKKAARGKYKGIVEVTKEPLVSTDILGTTASAIVDLNLTRVVDHDLVKVVAWYDNEWGYCCRLLEAAILVGGGKK
ncbi:MAG: type I glyceraldehyde-3-phosphate dehydrogenase [Candidatus Marinimicrobia bacterium]|nr:type I glyceraldehyde-3-phosphate dehydrogenase [Candidatus Neomarinimicrobiota bacterium]